jgi:hypothetical protein
VENKIDAAATEAQLDLYDTLVARHLGRRSSWSAVRCLLTIDGQERRTKSTTWIGVRHLTLAARLSNSPTIRGTSALSGCGCTSAPSCGTSTSSSAPITLHGHCAHAWSTTGGSG